MKKKLKFYIWSFSGSDARIIVNCAQKHQKRFTIIGFSVLGIFVLSYLSMYYAFNQLFSSDFIALLVGVFFSLMISNIYLFLLYTFNKSSKLSDPSRFSRGISISTRILFVSFIAIIIAKPLEAAIFSDSVESEIKKFKRSKIVKYHEIAQNFFDSEILVLQDLLNTELALANNPNGSRLDSLRNQILAKQHEQKRISLEMNRLVKNSNYFAQGIIILTKEYPATNLITLGVLVLFIMPVYFKLSIPEDSIFYREKNELEKEIILNGYYDFKMHYSRVLLEVTGNKVEYSESYVDPPFNTVKKSIKIKTLTEDELLNLLYSDED